MDAAAFFQPPAATLLQACDTGNAAVISTSSTLGIRHLNLAFLAHIDGLT